MSKRIKSKEVKERKRRKESVKSSRKEERVK